MRAWLQTCTLAHECIYRTGFVPTQLLNVKLNVSGNLRLELENTAGKERYIALSHCWGTKKPGGGIPKYCTSKGNFKDRQEGFSLDELPKTFRDAVKVTVELGEQYLWIDSLCIIQGDSDDWAREVEKMEDVYASAYCTIAATASPDSFAGFLVDRYDEDIIDIRGGLGPHISACTITANFDDDTEGAEINKRAWTMQERLLSLRTIHFTRNQAFGECGNGVINGGQVCLRCPQASKKFFQLDPLFPERLYFSGVKSTVNYLQSMLENYTQRNITNPTDRSVAILGLLARIKRTLGTSVHHGILDLFLHRTLLWRRVDSQKRTKRIAYDKVGKQVPSWSWMAYEGGVKFADDEFGALGLIHYLKVDRNGMYLHTNVWVFTDRDIKMEPRLDSLHYELLNSKAMRKRWISLDDIEENSQSMEFNVVLVARRRKFQSDNCRYFVLFVKQRASTDQFERLGIGMLTEDCKLTNAGLRTIF